MLRRVNPKLVIIRSFLVPIRVARFGDGSRRNPNSIGRGTRVRVRCQAECTVGEFRCFGQHTVHIKVRYEAARNSSTCCLAGWKVIISHCPRRLRTPMMYVTGKVGTLPGQCDPGEHDGRNASNDRKPPYAGLTGSVPYAKKEHPIPSHFVYPPSKPLS